MAKPFRTTLVRKRAPAGPAIPYTSKRPLGAPAETSEEREVDGVADRTPVRPGDGVGVGEGGSVDGDGRGDGAPKRGRSRLAQAGIDAQRTLLLVALEAARWNLSLAAEALQLTGAADVLRSIKTLDLTEEYEAARARGAITPGSRRDR